MRCVLPFKMMKWIQIFFGPVARGKLFGERGKPRLIDLYEPRAARNFGASIPNRVEEIDHLGSPDIFETGAKISRTAGATSTRIGAKPNASSARSSGTCAERV